jgi:hypothetical protein
VPVTPIITASSNNYLPVVSVKTSFSSYEPFTIDFQSSNTVVWADNCTQALIANLNVSCTAYPTLLGDSFNLGLADESGLIIGSFTNMTFSGYLTSGFIVLNEVCFYNATVCKIIRIYVVTIVSANNWFYGVAGANGMVGVGPGSPFVRQFIDVSTNTMTYSIVVGRGSSQVTKGTLGATTTAPTNITFGVQADSYYANQTSYLSLTADQNTGTYYLSSS